MYRIRRFGVLRTATVVALFYLVTVAIFVVPFILFVLLYGTSPGLSVPAATIGIIIGGAIAGLIIYPIIGWVITAVACLIYNFVARFAGGIEVDVDRVVSPAPPPGYGYGQPFSQATGQVPWGPPEQPLPPSNPPPGP